ncbi:cytochrome P450, partial [Phaeosphaeriaceae sp. PMI808]
MTLWISIVGLVGLLLCLRTIVVVIYRLYVSPLKAIPGPRLNALTSIPHDIVWIKGSRHVYLENLHNKYGPIVRVAPTEVSFIDSSIWRDVFGFLKNDAECEKSDKQQRNNGATGILDANRMNHRRVRRLISHAFSDQSLRLQEDRMQSHVDNLIKGLLRQSTKGPVEITEWLHWTAFDIMGDLALGESFNSLEAMKTHPWQQFIMDHIVATVYIGLAERWGISRIAAFTTPPSLIQAVETFYSISSDMVEKRMQNKGSDRGDFLDHILRFGLVTNETKGQSKGLGLEELKNTSSDIAIAGSETTATLLSGLIFYLLKNPDVLHKVTNEVRTLKSSDDITISSTLTELPYLKAVIEEGMRIFVPAPILAARSIKAGGLAVGGYWLPGGTRVFASQHIAYRSNSHFARPKEFIPERWLPDRPREFENDNASDVFYPFSFGPRNCIGSHLARAEMRVILTKLLWHFDLHKPHMGHEEAKQWEAWEDGLEMYFAWRKPPLMVQFTERN